MKREVTHYILARSVTTETGSVALRLMEDGRFSAYGYGKTKAFKTERSARIYAKNTGVSQYTIVPVQREPTDQEMAEIMASIRQKRRD